ncbi:energy transducer TonB [Caulobacter sp. CCUG 60055]|uniref:energy transducer TonB n=1 Tax=Caulobacter sp. CCUG 60055 TaxID=2100090 RepID=UPI001FA7C808|nr:energy transducer TonB [Caulobacter sp. CCUG 60055]
MVSLAVHGGVAAYVLHLPPASTAPPRAAAGDGEPRAVSVQLVRAGFERGQAPSSPATSSAIAAPAEGQEATAAKPVGQDGRRPGEEAPGQAAAPAAPEAAASTPLAGVSTISSDYQRRLLAHIQPFKRYPDEAERTGVRGVVQLVFELDRRGRLLGVWVAHSSGSPVLDAAAVDTVRRAAPLPPIPGALPDDLSVQLPVEFNGPMSRS